MARPRSAGSGPGSELLSGEASQELLLRRLAMCPEVFSGQKAMANRQRFFAVTGLLVLTVVSPFTPLFPLSWMLALSSLCMAAYLEQSEQRDIFIKRLSDQYRAGLDDVPTRGKAKLSTSLLFSKAAQLGFIAGLGKRESTQFSAHQLLAGLPWAEKWKLGVACLLTGNLSPSGMYSMWRGSRANLAESDRDSGLTLSFNGQSGTVQSGIATFCCPENPGDDDVQRGPVPF